MRAGIDVGGTFTDLVVSDAAEGSIVVGKALNEATDPVAGVTGALAAADVDRDRLSEMVHGTTMVTNLLIERTGASVGLICSRGFRDLLEIQWSWRPKTFDLRYEKTPPLIPRELRLEVGGRISANGEEQEPIDAEEIKRTVQLLKKRGVQALVVALYNSYANPAHELDIREVAEATAPGLPVTLSTEVDRRIGEYPRVSTATLNAMAMPRVGSYVAALEKVIPAPTYYMHSAGGMIPADEARMRPIYLAFSGPAAGVLAGREVAGELGFQNAITMDMGGTSCDVCLVWDGEFQYREQVDIEWGIPARIRSLALHTVGAGGGSIAWRDSGGALKVGPMSAGASPGPACYGRGGAEPTVSDANLVLGILSASTGLIGGQFRLDAEAAHKALWGLGEDFGVSATEAAAGVYAVVNANMAQAIREITVRQGMDPRECVLVAFGGAGAQHATGVAHELGIRRVLIPANGGVLSAVGLLMADLQVTSQETVLRPVEQLDSAEVEESFARLAADAMRRLKAGGEGEPDLKRSAGMRYVAQSQAVAVPVTGDAERARQDFEDEHQRLFGTRLGDPVEVVDLYVTATVGDRARPRPSAFSQAGLQTPSGEGSRRLELVGEEVPVFQRGAVAPETWGPCLIEEANSVTLVPRSGKVVAADPHIVVELEAR